MKTIKINEKEVTHIEDWSEMSMGNYLKLIELQTNKDNLLEEQFLLQFITLISDLTYEELDAFYEEDLMPLALELKSFNIENFVKQEKRHFVFNGIDYCVVIPNKLTMGENISLKLLEKKSINLMDSWLNIISILIRPATKSIDEFGEIIYTPNKFEGDELLLLKRKELFKQVPAVNAIWILEAFTLGRK